MTYSLTWSDATLKPTIISVAGGAANNSTSLTLTGKGYVNWGVPLQESLMHLLENFASNNIIPTNPTIGQIWYNADVSSNHLQLNTTAGWKEIAYRRVDSATPPAGVNYTGDVWFDTTNHVLSVLDTSWKPLAYQVQVQGNYSLDTGTANHYVIALTPPITSYGNNFVGSFKVAHASTGACKINAGGGERDLFNDNGGALSAGDLPLNAIVSYVFVQADNCAYVTSIVKSQLDTVYAAIGGNTQNFKVAAAVASTDAVPLSQVQSLITAVAAVPTGTIIDFAGPTEPAGFIACPLVSTLVSTTGIIPGHSPSTYANLFAVIGHTWGGSGLNFGLPFFPADYAAVQATQVPQNIGTQQDGVVKAHTHTYLKAQNPAPQSGSSTACLTSTIATETSAQTPAGGPANLAAGMRIMKCIKY